ncbi:hypothetical protein predicted by Glimmer/Critica [Helicobacter pylori B8]|uniref:Uncharacterized protein n=1 Tax=Helicobacter pylori (strain B8) TaxID=693745 RepID=D7FEZ0_HELP3|nr:hypothetical protein predicted by Glimmer/Critica [Helicobacter pylori B8]
MAFRMGIKTISKPIAGRKILQALKNAQKKSVRANAL